MLRPREPVPDTGTELCIAAPERRSAVCEAKEACAGRNCPENHRLNELRAARETPVFNQLILLMEKPKAWKELTLGLTS